MYGWVFTLPLDHIFSSLYLTNARRTSMAPHLYTVSIPDTRECYNEKSINKQLLGFFLYLT